MKSISEKNTQEDERLVNFLQSHCPPTPCEKTNAEDLLFRVIATQKREVPQYKGYWSWLLPTGLITGALLIWGATTSTQQRVIPQVAQEIIELEAFMIDSWNKSMAQDQEYDPEFDYVTLSNEL